MTQEEQTEISDKGNVSAKPEAIHGAKNYTISAVETNRARGATDFDQHHNNQQADRHGMGFGEPRSSVCGHLSVGKTRFPPN